MQEWGYFDYAATTPVHPLVAEQVFLDMTSGALLGNANASHGLGLQARVALQSAREQLATLLEADARELVFTSGATEANNLALKGAFAHSERRNGHLLTLQSEHKSVLDCAGILAKNGVRVSVLPVLENGQVDLAALEAVLSNERVSLVSVMAVNNETGVVAPVEEVVALAHRYGAKVHVDAAQALGKVAVSMARWQADLVSFSGHKVYAPQGIGMLYVRRLPKMRLQALLHGGGQERGLRSGTSPVMLVRALELAVRLAVEALGENQARVGVLYQTLVAGLPQSMAVNVGENVVENIVSVNTGRSASEVLARASEVGLALSAGSACQAASSEGSHVLRAMGLDVAAHQSVRVSLSHLTREDELARLLNFLHDFGG